MFVDLSGFSTMTDTLSQHGSRGAEVLAEMMRVVFEPLVGAVYSQGGFVIGYAGDAFNAVFSNEQARGQAAMRCLASAVSMQTHANSHSEMSTPFGVFPIHIKVGIGFGETKWQIFKSLDKTRATYWFRGQSLNGAVEGESCAESGDIVLSQLAYSILKDNISCSQVDNCFCLRKVDVDLPAPLLVSSPKPVEELIKIFFPEAITGLPMAGEFRQSVNLFIDIPTSITDEALVAPFMETVYLLQEHYGGYFLRPDLGDKGFNLLMMWGAPIAYENDVERALNFILELSARTRLPLRAGLSYRMAYAGFIGASLREDYTAYGWGVNLAARLMENSGPGEFWMDAEIARRAEKHFHINFLDEYKFKGFHVNQKTFRLIGRKQAAEAVYQGQLVGRKGELESLASFVDPLKEGKFAGVMVLKGEAGIGKSRLVHTFQLSDYFHDQSTNWVVCQADEILRLPFNPFKDWLKERFELLEGHSDKINLIAFSRNIQELIDVTPDAELAAELARTISVLAALIDISVPGSLYESLSAKGRYENTLIALSVFLRAESLQKPIVLFMEDTHWLDEETGEFISYFVRSLLAESAKQYPIAIIATQRPEGDSVKMMDEVSMSGIRLGKLSTASLNLLAEEILGKPISNSLTKLLDDRADGNPFFAEQILRYLLEQNALTLDESGKYFASENAQISLPTDVRAVLIARLDQLTQRVRETVQTASVLGRDFEVRVLAEMLKNDDYFVHSLDQAEKANIWAPLTELEYIFKHALLRDAAYSMQLVVHQREMHKLAVSAMEVVYRDDMEPHYGELAYHAEKAELQEKALHYLTMAGELAMSVFQNHQAVDYFTRALLYVPVEDLPRKFNLLLKRVECNFQAGNPFAQVDDLALLENMAAELNEPLFFAQVFNRQAYLAARQGDYKRVVEYALKAKAIAEQIGEDDILFAINLVIPNALAHLGRLEDAMKYAHAGLEFSHMKKDITAEARSLSVLGLVALEVEGPSAAFNYQSEALRLSRLGKSRTLEASILDNLANAVGLAQGDFHTAREYFQQAMLIFSEYGDYSSKGHVMANLGWVAGILGDYPAALAYYEQALVISRQMGSRMEEMFTYVNLSSSASAQGHADDALRWAKTALDVSVKIGDKIGEAWSFYCIGLANNVTSQFEEAVNSFTKSIEIRELSNAIPLVIESRAGLVNALWGLGDQVSAQREAELILTFMEKDKSFEGAEEPLRIYLALFEHLNKKKDPRAQVVLQNANNLLSIQVAKLRSNEARLMFVDNVPWRRAIAEAAKKLNL